MSGKILKNIWENTSQLVTVVLLEGSARVGSEEGNRDFFYIYSQNIFLMFFSYINNHPISCPTHNVINLCNLIELHNYSNKHSWHEEVSGKNQQTVGRYTAQWVREEAERLVRERGAYQPG